MHQHALCRDNVRGKQTGTTHRSTAHAMHKHALYHLMQEQPLDEPLCGSVEMQSEAF
jgi:hypothetical protein